MNGNVTSRKDAWGTAERASEKIRSCNIILDRNPTWLSGKRHTEGDLRSSRNPYPESKILSPSCRRVVHQGSVSFQAPRCSIALWALGNLSRRLLFLGQRCDVRWVGSRSHKPSQKDPRQVPTLSVNKMRIEGEAEFRAIFMAMSTT